MSVRLSLSGNAVAMAAMTALLALVMLLPVPGQADAQAMRFGGEARPVQATAAFDGVGRLECRGPDGRAEVRDATGWLLGAADTVITAAHTFYAGAAAIEPRRCLFRLYNPDGSTRQAARVRYLRSPWIDPALRNDSAHDVAVLKLDRIMQVRAIPAVSLARGVGARPVRLISFPGETVGGGALISSGEASPFPLGPGRDAEDGMRISDPSRLFASSADSARGSSGGMYVAPGSGAAIGLHVGYACGRGGCFNFGLRFDAKLLAMIAEVASDRTEPAAQFASAGRLVL